MATRERWYVQHFTVLNQKGYPFPIDMLRRDACWPASEAEAGNITSTFYPEVFHKSGRKQSKIETPKVKIVGHCRTKHGMITEKRWESFGWPVDPDSIEVELLT